MTTANATAIAGWATTFPPLAVEVLPNGNLRLEEPTENSEGYTAVVDVHPMQLRLMAERLGMIHEVSTSDAALLKSEREYAQRQRVEIDLLRRKLLVLRDRGVKLQADFRRYAPLNSADLGTEMEQIDGLVNLLDLAVLDFADDYEVEDPEARAAASPPATARPAPPPAPATSAASAEIAPLPEIPHAQPAPHPQRDLLEAAP